MFAKKFSKLEIGPDSRSKLELPELSPGAWIEGRPANQSNPAYFSALMRKAGPQARAFAKSGKVAQILRDANRELYPKYILTGWSVLDDEDKEVEFSTDEAEQMCRQCPDWLFERITGHFESPESFLDYGDASIDVETLAGNSNPGSSGS